MELSRQIVKHLRSLSKRSVRDEEGVFWAEGRKLVEDLLPFFPCVTLVATEDFMSTHPDCTAEQLYVVGRAELEKVSMLRTPPSVAAVFRKPDYQLEAEALRARLSLMLDTVQDPGNMGTIIRIADWFGIEDIICSPDTVDVYNPKVIQATMGAIARVRVHYHDLPSLLSSMQDMPVYGTFLDGEDIYQSALSANGIIVMGNEGNGISDEVGRLVTHRLLIPNFPQGRFTSESLNVAVATAVTCAEFRRRVRP